MASTPACWVGILVRRLWLVLPLWLVGCAHLPPRDCDCRQVLCAPGFRCERDSGQVSQYHCVEVR